MKLSEALQESEKHIRQLIELLDVNGVGQQSDALVAARKFSEEYLRYIRTRRCCMNCAFCKPDDGALHVGKVSDPMMCTHGAQDGERPVYLPYDHADIGLLCSGFALKHEIKEVK